MRRFCQKQHIILINTRLDHPHKDGVTDKMNRTIVNLVHVMIIGAELPKIFWKYAFQFVTHHWNHWSRTNDPMDTSCTHMGMHDKWD